MALDWVRDIARDGLSPTIDRALGSSVGYDTPTAVPVQDYGSGTGTRDADYRPVDTTPGERGGIVVSQQNLLIGGVALVGVIGLILVLR